ncbi:MAG: MFS transporter [Oxalobacteraceae bacterium]|nr:MAG: MFS transporter [Oxalobacteraceae bacterium]
MNQRKDAASPSRHGAAREWRQHGALLLAATVGMSLPAIYVFSLGTLIEPIQRDLGWTRAQITSGLPIATIIAAALGPVVGILVDRFGSRRLALPGIIVFCCGLAMLSLTSSPRSWWLLWALIGVLSAGVKPTVWVTTVSTAFTAGRGRALAVALSGSPIATAVLPLLTTILVRHVGWRGAYVGLALIWAAVALPLVILFFHDVRGTLPHALARTALPGSSVWSAIRTRRYLFLAGSGFILSLTTLGLGVSMVPMLSADGFSRIDAAKIAGLGGVFAVVGRLVSGYLYDKYGARWVAAVCAAFPAITGLLLYGFPGSYPAAMTANGLMGLSQGAELGAISYLVGRYFGLARFGTLFGIGVSVTMLATGIGPMLANLIYDKTGSYHAVMLLAVPLSLAGAAMLAGLGPMPADEMAD